MTLPVSLRSPPASPRSAAADFPVLAQEGLTYLDSAATAQTARPVIEAMDAYYNEYRASIHRGVYPLAARATDAAPGPSGGESLLPLRRLHAHRC